MGAQLYYKETPKEQEESYDPLYKPTWDFLVELYNLEDREDAEGTILNESSIEKLHTARMAAKFCGGDDLVSDIAELISAIKKYKSITLYIRH